MEFKHNGGRLSYRWGSEGLSKEQTELYESLLNDLKLLKPSLAARALPYSEPISFLEGVLHAINLTLDRDTLWRSAGKPLLSIHVVRVPAHTPSLAIGFESDELTKIVIPNKGALNIYTSALSMFNPKRVHDVQYADILNGEQT